jgi:TusA-related sulfurtransferase
MVKLFGYRAVDQTTTELINNIIIPPSIPEENEYTLKLVEKLSMGKVIEIEESITYEEFRKTLDKWCEKQQHHQVVDILCTKYWIKIKWGGGQENVIGLTNIKSSIL